ncbi:TPA: hypothetical protein ACGOYL_001540 [Streptococcus suis]|nr:hypothetical protein [Streptococcus suis]HEM6271752.1 hypothetical protein [Streptococcus suis]
MDTRQYNVWSINFFYISMAIFPLSIIMRFLFTKLGFAFIAGKSIYICYAIVYLFATVILVRFGISLKRFASLYFINLLYLVLYFTSDPSVKNIFSGVVMVMIYVYYLPYSVLILSRITDFTHLFSSKFIEYMNYFIIISSFIMKYVFDDQTNYMPYSYNLLPIWILFSMNFIQKPNLLKAGVSVVMLLEGVIYGARGPLIWLVIGVLFCSLLEMINKRVLANLSIKIIGRFILSLGVLTGIFLFLSKTLSSISSEGSYILSRLQQGDLGDSSGRKAMIDIAITYLKQMGGEINGVFFDRTLMPQKLYVHNLILETYLSFGWFLGTIILLSIIYFVGKTFIISSITNKKVIIFAVSSFFLKYFLSGSMYEGESFIIMLALVFAVYRQEKINRQEFLNKFE